MLLQSLINQLLAPPYIAPQVNNGVTKRKAVTREESIALYRSVMYGRGRMSSTEIGDALDKTSNNVNQAMKNILIRDGHVRRTEDVMTEGSNRMTRSYKWIGD